MIKRRSKPRRVSVARDPKYLTFLRSQGMCPVCGKIGQLWNIYAAHGPVNGMSSKGSDLEAIPLCHPHHMEQHAMGWPAFCERYHVNREVEVAYWNRKYKEMTNDESSK